MLGKRLTTKQPNECVATKSLTVNKLWRREVNGSLEAARQDRYKSWDTAAARSHLEGGLDGCFDYVTQNAVSPEPRSARQERLENLINRFV